jgi:hypothetical protein
LLSSGQEFDEKFLDSKHVLKVYFKPSRKNLDFGFLPLPSKLVRLKNPYLKEPSNLRTIITEFVQTMDPFSRFIAFSTDNFKKNYYFHSRH